MQLFILHQPQDKLRVVQAIAELQTPPAYAIEIKRYKRVRSLAQNRLMWMWINQIAEHTGHDIDEIHEMLKRRLLGTVRREILGDSYDVAKSTTVLTTGEFTQYLERIEQVAALLMITLVKPDDYSYAMHGG